MRKHTKKLWAGSLVAALAAGAVANSLVAPAEDLSTLPPAFKDLARQLAGNSVSLTDAIRAAESETRGAALSAAVGLGADAGQIIVTTISDEARRIVTVSADSGAVVRNQDWPRIPGESVPGDTSAEGWVATDSGLMYYDIVEGDGPSPAGPAAPVTVHYTGYLVDGAKFDSSHDRGEPITFPLNRVISGWTEGVGSMKVGGKRKLVIPFDLAYGPAGRPPVIPARAMLVFDVELISTPSDSASEQD